jgi:hypothetical protein
VSHDQAQLITAANERGFAIRAERNNAVTAITLALAERDFPRIQRILDAVKRNAQVTAQINARKDEACADAVLSDIEEREDRERPDRFDPM